ncbi:MAG: hypothetical protein JNM17_26655 [Archangium sp.]|nr:hypothetical protein [Archangium sp.]
MSDEPIPPQEKPSPTAHLDEQQKLIEKMERDLEKPNVGVLPPVAALAMLAALALAYWMKTDVEYFFSSRVPIELGAEGDYHVDQAVSNRYAQIHGVPTVKGWYVEEKDGSFVVIGLNDTKVLVKRVTFEDENRRLPDGKRPQPRQNPFFARGRLMSRVDAERYEDVFKEYEAWSGGVKAEWMLMAEQPPGKDYGSAGMFSFVMVFALVNAWLFVRGLTLKRRPKKT